MIIVWEADVSLLQPRTCADTAFKFRTSLGKKDRAVKTIKERRKKQLGVDNWFDYRVCQIVAFLFKSCSGSYQGSGTIQQT